MLSNMVENLKSLEFYEYVNTFYYVLKCLKKY